MFYNNSHERIMTRSRVPIFIIYLLKHYNKSQLFAPILKNISNAIQKVEKLFLAVIFHKLLVKRC